MKCVWRLFAAARMDEAKVGKKDYDHDKMREAHDRVPMGSSR